MPTVLPSIVDRMVALMEGSYGSATRAIPARRFVLVQQEVELALSNASQRPRPFEIIDDGEYQPSDVPSTLSGSQVWHGCRLMVRVGYARQHKNQHTQRQEIQADRFQIRRALGYPPNYAGVTGYARSVVEEGEISEIALSVESDYNIMLVLEIPVELTYREDHS